MSDTELETNFDPFDEEGNDEANQNADEGAGKDESQNADEGNSADEPNGGEAEGQADGNPEGEPAANDKDGNKPEKMIPESRFKAALKDVTEERDALRAENAKFKAAPIPDKNTDPEGYVRHVRLETSKRIMRDTHPDYEEVIVHFQKMAKENPFLNDQVANHEMPAKFAYDLAKRNMEITEVTNARNSDEWKEFQQFRKDKAAGKLAATTADKLSSNPASKLPTNLNRATSANRVNVKVEDDSDELFKGAL